MHSSETNPRNRSVDCDHLYGLRDTIICALLLAGFFSLPGLVALCEAESPEYADGEVRDPEMGRIRRRAWPLLKDPDSLLAIQAMIRCAMLAIMLSKIRHSQFKWETYLGTTWSRIFVAVGLWLLSVSYAMRVCIFQFPWLRLEGPIGGKMDFTFDICVSTLLLILVCTWLKGRSLKELTSTVILLTALLRMAFHIAGHNYMEIDPRAPVWGNIGFSFVFVAEAAACLFILGGVLMGACMRPPVLLGLLAVIQQALSLYYFLDTFRLGTAKYL